MLCSPDSFGADGASSCSLGSYIRCTFCRFDSPEVWECIEVSGSKIYSGAEEHSDPEPVESAICDR